VSTGRKFAHDATAYERPTQPYLCGRGSLWRKACWQGPGAAGQCGGAFECIPVRIRDRWECRRPKQAGGRCSEGPLPNGSCAHPHAPCVPATSLRRTRGRASLGAALLLLMLLILAPDPTATSVVNPAAVDAGNLSSVHAGFTREQGCSACHASHGKDAWGWFTAAFRSNDPSAGCLDCHGFAEPVMRAHNTQYAKRGDLGEVSCVRCHSEHKGAQAALGKVPDYVCGNCHEKSFDKFVGRHPQFAERYPYTTPGAIYFNHSKHIKEYFSDPKHAKRSPKFAAVAKTQCTVCHAVKSATREVRPKPYVEICAGCHDAQIQKAELVLLEPEKMTWAGSVLLGMEKDGDEAEANKRLGKLFGAMARSGSDALASLLPREAKKQPLLDALSARTAQSAGAAWAARKQLSRKDADGPGWFAGENADGNPSLFYRPRGHADPVVRAWNEHLRLAQTSTDQAQGQIASEAFDQFLDGETGPGVCGKCHGAALRRAAPEKVSAAWSYSGSAPRPFVKYSHAPHLELLDPAAGCTRCHEINAGVRYAKYHAAKQPKPDSYESNFAGIKKETCATCHRGGHVDASCQVCHSYHREHQLNLGFRQKSPMGGNTK